MTKKEWTNDLMHEQTNEWMNEKIITYEPNR